MLGVTREILDSELGSARGEDDFFSVARTIPLVAALGQSVMRWELGWGGAACL
jgi:hypothetical protein